MAKTKNVVHANQSDSYKYFNDSIDSSVALSYSQKTIDSGNVTQNMKMFNRAKAKATVNNRRKISQKGDLKCQNSGKIQKSRVKS